MLRVRYTVADEAALAEILLDRQPTDAITYWPPDPDDVGDTRCLKDVEFVCDCDRSAEFHVEVPCGAADSDETVLVEWRDEQQDDESLIDFGTRACETRRRWLGRIEELTGRRPVPAERTCPMPRPRRRQRTR